MSDRVDDIKKEINEKFKHHCDTCDYHTNVKSKLDRHLNTIKHKEGKGKRDTSKFKYHCNICNYHSEYESGLTRHFNSIKHIKNTAINPNIFDTDIALLIFIQICKICGFEYTYESEDNLCWSCRLERIDEMIEYEECENSRIFCKLDDCLYCYNKSFLSNPKYIYLDIEFGIDPRQISKQTGNKFTFICKCSHKFCASLDNIHKNKWCPYCCYPGKKLCEDECIQCFNNSFASHEKSKYWSDKNEISPRYVLKGTNKLYWFNCNKCPHDFQQIPKEIIGRNYWCTYCSHSTLCNKECEFCFNNSFASHPMSEFWSLKNKKFPRDVFLNTHEKYLFICDTCDNEFKISPACINNGNWCSICKNKTERKFKEWFNDFFDYKLEHLARFRWKTNDNINFYKLSFDFLISELDVLIEIDGRQHFEQVLNWTSYKLVQKVDVYKMKHAIKNNITVIRICQEDIWYDKYNWKSDIKQHIKKYDNPTVIYLSRNKNLYDYHKYLMTVDTCLTNNINSNFSQIVMKYI